MTTITNKCAAYQLHIIVSKCNQKSQFGFHNNFNRIYRLLQSLNEDMCNTPNVSEFESKKYTPFPLRNLLKNVTEPYQYRDIVIDYSIQQLQKLYPTLNIGTSDTDDIIINTDPRGYPIKTSETIAKKYNMTTDWGGYGILTIK